MKIKFFSFLILSTLIIGMSSTALAKDEILEAGVIFKSGSNLNEILNHTKKKKSVKDQIYAMKKYTEPIVKGIKGLETRNKYAINNFIVYGTIETHNLSAKVRYDLLLAYKKKYSFTPNSSADWEKLLKLNKPNNILKPKESVNNLKNQIDHGVKEKNSNVCNPDDKKVTEELKFLKKYDGKNLETSAGNFLVVEALKKEEEWIYNNPYPVWNVCDKPVVYITKMPSAKEGFNKVFYNGNIYSVPIGSIPNYESHNKISFMNAGIKEEHKFPVISESSIKHFGSSTAYIAKIKDAKEGYPKTMLVLDEKIISNDYEYVGYANGWDNSFVMHEGELAYIVANKPQYYWEKGASVPTNNNDVKYQVIWKNKVISDSYDFIRDLAVINNKLSYTATDQGKSFIIYNGKRYGEEYVVAANVMETGGGNMAYIGVDKDRNYHIMKESEEIFNFKPWVFYPTRSGNSFGDITFVNSKLAISVSNKNYSDGYILYGKNKIVGVSGSVKNIGNKLIIVVPGWEQVLIER